MEKTVKHIKISTMILFLIGLAIGGVAYNQRSTHAKAGQSSTATVIVANTCSLTATLNASHVAMLLNGQETTNIGTTTIAANCNDPSGFTIYAAGYTGDTVNAASSTALVGANTGLFIETGSGTTNSNWGMKVTALAGDYPVSLDSDYSAGGYNVVPKTYDRVAYRESATGAGTGGAAKITTTYRAYVSPTQAADSYSGKVRYVIVHPAAAIATPDFDTAFALAGKKTYINKAGIDTGYYAMQDMTSAICNGVVDYNTETQLIDTRDEKLYWVLKAQDGKCWMTENLDLDLETNVALTSLNTDLNVYDDDIYNENYGYTYNESTGLITWTPAMATYHNNAIHQDGKKTGDNITNDNQHYTPRSWNLTVNGSEIYQKDGSTFSSTNCNYFTTPSCLNSTGDNTNTTANFSTVPYAANGEHGKIGNYYNWSAAVASNDTTTRVDSTYNAIADNPKNSICPKGWRLTRSSATAAYNDFRSLYAAYGNAIGKANGYPLWLVRAGNVLSGTLEYNGYNGRYWSSTVYSAVSAYSLTIDSGDFSPSYNYGSNRFSGRSVRCVAR
ncbi:hypothetical protein IJI00_00645 [Candidatus Saccharibacteria bacterium]|nr:hypothetical protein [Candidatus Saccharibacteria bacterium]